MMYGTIYVWDGTDQVDWSVFDLETTSSFQQVYSPRSSARSMHSENSGQSTYSGLSRWLRQRRRRNTNGLQGCNSTSGNEFGEIVWDSGSAYSNGSEISVSSGRRGPLNKATRATMKAVKMIGACWRCKILRKPVSIAPGLIW
jgi:hypothetical protein